MKRHQVYPPTHPAPVKTEWRRVTRSLPCPVCGKPDWCLIDVQGEAAICARIESPKMAGQAGWVHQLGEDMPERVIRRVVTLPPEPRKPTIDCDRLQNLYARDCDEDDVEFIASQLGVTAKSLWMMHIGWSAATQAFTFPMRDGAGNITGFRLRNEKGKKWAVKGSVEGLFLGPYMEGPIIVCEGPTDAAALLDAGYAVVGRPSNRGGLKLLTQLFKRIDRDRPVAIVCDRDRRGTVADKATMAGATELATRLTRMRRKVKLLRPPRHKDVRAWVNDLRRDGRSPRPVIEAVIHNANTFQEK